jgi:amidase
VGLLSAVDATSAEVAEDCVAAVQACGALLESLGHGVEPGGPPRLFDDELVANWSAITAARLRRLIEVFGAGLGRVPGEADVEPYQLALAATGEMTASALLAREEWQQLYASRIAAWWEEGFDVLVTPTTGEPPVVLDALVPPLHDPLALLPRFLRIQCFAIPFSVTGQPAVSLPLHTTAEGVPVGVQLVARHGAEGLLLRLAAQLEGAQPWEERRPPAAGS